MPPRPPIAVRASATRAAAPGRVPSFAEYPAGPCEPYALSSLTGRGGSTLLRIQRRTGLRIRPGILPQPDLPHGAQHYHRTRCKRRIGRHGAAHRNRWRHPRSRQQENTPEGDRPLRTDHQRPIQRRDVTDTPATGTYLRPLCPTRRALRKSRRPRRCLRHGHVERRADGVHRRRDGRTRAAG